MLHDYVFLLLGICLDEMLQTARRDGNVLIVVDTAGRVLELSQLLVKHSNVYSYIFGILFCKIIHYMYVN